MAFAADSLSISRMASLVGTMTNSTCRRSASSFTSFLHNWQTAVCSGADHKPVAFPWDLFADGQRRMPKLGTEPPGRCLLAFADFSAVNHHVPLVRAAVDSEATEGEFVEVHTHLLLLCVQAL